jgi:hypothetical protein
MIGWNAEAFARTNKIKPLGEYLKPPQTPEQKRNAGTARLIAALDRMAEEPDET